jgi:hypothetical protein
MFVIPIEKCVDYGEYIISRETHERQSLGRSDASSLFIGSQAASNPHSTFPRKTLFTSDQVLTWSDPNTGESLDMKCSIFLEVERIQDKLLSDVLASDATCLIGRSLKKELLTTLPEEALRPRNDPNQLPARRLRTGRQ